MAWIGGSVGAGAAVAAGTQNQSNRKSKWIYILSVVIALVAFLIVFSQV
ncbi:MAG: hypothetical protein ACFFCP_18605 [Promethearchaeota archaeon]